MILFRMITGEPLVGVRAILNRCRNRKNLHFKIIKCKRNLTHWMLEKIHSLLNSISVKTIRISIMIRFLIMDSEFRKVKSIMLIRRQCHGYCNQNQIKFIPMKNFRKKPMKNISLNWRCFMKNPNIFQTKKWWIGFLNWLLTC